METAAPVKSSEDMKIAIATYQRRIDDTLHSVIGKFARTPRQRFVIDELAIKLQAIVTAMKAAHGCNKVESFENLQEQFEKEVHDVEYPDHTDADANMPDPQRARAMIPAQFLQMVMHYNQPEIKAKLPVMDFDEQSKLAGVYLAIVEHPSNPFSKESPLDPKKPAMNELLASMTAQATKAFLMRDMANLKALSSQYRMVLDVHQWEPLKVGAKPKRQRK